MTRSVQTNFTADGGTGSVRKAPAKKAAASKPAKPEGGPADGTVDEVLESVGDDKAKAQAALDAENAKDKPRKTLVEELEGILADEPEDEDGDEE